MTQTRYDLIDHIEALIDSGVKVDHIVLLELRGASRNVEFLKGFSPLKFQILISKIYLSFTNLDEKLLLIAVIANILFTNDDLRTITASHDEFNILDTIKFELIPNLLKTLDLLDPLQFNSESQYKEFLSLFRIYYLLSHNTLLIPNLTPSVLKIAGKLLNFVTLSSYDSFNLNNIIIEILKIFYNYLHQSEDTDGIDSPFVLSCNKFQIKYHKGRQARTINNFAQIDEILQHFGNVLVAIPPSVSQNYMLNKLKFAENEVSFLNKLTNSPNSASKISPTTPLTNLLTLDVLVSIDDFEESGVKECIEKELDFAALELLPIEDPNILLTLRELKRKVQLSDSASFVNSDFAPSTSTAATSPLDEFDKILIDSEISKYRTTALDSTLEKEVLPRFEDLSAREQDEEINKMEKLFGDIEKNGVFKLQMK